MAPDKRELRIRRLYDLKAQLNKLFLKPWGRTTTRKAHRVRIEISCLYKKLNLRKEG